MELQGQRGRTMQGACRDSERLLLPVMWVRSGEMNRSVSEGSRDQIMEGLGYEDE